jgi:hypothetical protein
VPPAFTELIGREMLRFAPSGQVALFGKGKAEAAA